MVMREAPVGRKEVARVILAGPYPPPIGGISIHVERLAARLDAAGYDARVVGWGSRTVIRNVRRWTLHWALSPLAVPAVILCQRGAQTVVHLHFSTLRRSWLPLRLWTATLRGLPYIVTIHGGQFATSSHPLSSGAKRLLTGARTVIAVSEQIRQELGLQLGGHQTSVEVIPAYLQGSRGRLPADVETRVGAAASADSPLVLVTGILRPEYGFHDVLTAANLEGERRWTVVCATYGAIDREYQRACLALSGEHVVWVRDLAPDGFQALLARATVLVRPTRTDGDSVAVREALGLGVTVLASDAVPRPAGVRTFACGEIRQLRAALEEVVEANLPRMQSSEDGDGWGKLQEVYRHMFEERIGSRSMGGVVGQVMDGPSGPRGMSSGKQAP